MLRNRSNLLLGVSAALFVAGLVGVQLGESAIAGINPVFFEGPAEPPRGIDPNSIGQPRQASYYQAYDWAQGNEARAAACGDCGTFPSDETYAFAAPEPRLAGQNWRDPTPVTDLEPWSPGDVRVVRGNGNVARYADYPIEQKPVDEADEPEPVARPDYQQDDVYEE